MLLGAALATTAVGYDNGAPHSRLPMLGWSSWVALGPGSGHPLLDYCDEASLMAAADAMVKTGLVAAGYNTFHLDDCTSAAASPS